MDSEPTQRAGFRFREHTADVAVEAWGADPQEAFAQMARGMYALMLGGNTENRREEAPAVHLSLAVHGEGWEQLLVNFLAELLLLVETEGFVAQRITFDQCTPPRCDAHLEGRSVDFATEAMGLAVKAVTYHQIQVHMTPSETRLQVIFDI